MEVHPDGNIVAYGGYGGRSGQLLLSTDDGHTWRPATIESTGAYIITLAIGPEGVLYAGGMSGFAGYPSGVFHSTDEGESWQYIGLGSANVSAILADTGGIIIAGINGYTDVGGPELHRSTDGGETWTRILEHRQLKLIIALAKDSADNFWLAQTESLLRSTDRGGTWDSVTSMFRVPKSAVTAFTVRPDGSLLVGTTSGPYLSTDDGASWTISSGWPDSADVLGFAVFDTTIIAGTDIGILQSTDGGASWEERNRGMLSSVYNLVAGHGNRLMARTGVGVQVTADGGTSWKRISPNSESANALAISPAGTFFIGTDRGSLYSSSGDGSSWRVTRPAHRITSLGTNNDGHLFAAMRYGVMNRSTDDGLTWDSTTIPFSASGVFAIAFDSATGYAATDDGLFRTTDNGGTWLSTNITERVESIAFGQHREVYVRGYQTLHHSTDNGTTWTSFTPSLPISSLAVTAQGTLMAASADRRNDSKRYVFQSDDGGHTWNPAQQGLPPDSLATELATSLDGTIFVGTRGYGIYRLSEGPLSVRYDNVVDDGIEVITTDGGATILLASEAGVHTDIAIYNSLGQRVASLFSDEPGAGTHRFTWLANGLPSGVYVVNICRDGRCATRRVVIAR
jgi:photosystem II stability/assembly factor-like uncharacterized protein